MSGPEDLNANVLRELRRRSRRGFLAAGAAAAGTWGLLHWSNKGGDALGQSESVQQKFLRNVLEWNASVSRTVFGERTLAPTYPLAKAARDARVNGPIGIDGGLKLDGWRLQVVGVKNPKAYAEYVTDVDTFTYPLEGETSATSPFVTDTDTKETSGSKSTAVVPPDPSIPTTPGLLLSMEKIRQLPHVEMVTQLKCIEGWSQIVHWGGVRFSDFINVYKPATSNGRPFRYVSMETPNGEYYVGLEMATAMHPQTLLCYEMSGEPLTRAHGAPLRLATSLKYGIKQLKQIGKITFTDERPRDYWAEQGYDWYAGL